MAKNYDRAQYYRHTADVCIDAVRLQIERIANVGYGAMPGLPDVKFAPKRSRHDVDFLVFSVWRLRETVKMTVQWLGSAARDLLADFDAAVPAIDDVRDRLMHPRHEPGALSDAWWFGDSIDRLLPGGRVVPLIDAEDVSSASEQLYKGFVALIDDRWAAPPK